MYHVEPNVLLFIQAHLQRCRGLIVLARRGDTYRHAEFVKVRSDGQVQK